MKKVLDIIIKVARWCGFGFFLILTIGTGVHISSLFFLLAAVMIMPIAPIKKVYEKLNFKTWMVAAIIVGLCLFGSAFAPKSESIETPSNESSVVDQDKVEEEKKDSKEDFKQEEPTEESVETLNREEQVESPEVEDPVNEQEIPDESPVQTPETPPETIPDQTTDSSQIEMPEENVPDEEESLNEQTPDYSTDNGTVGDADNDDSDGTVVYRTPSGKRYHLDPQCGGKNSYEVTMNTALSSGLTACQKCAI